MSLNLSFLYGTVLLLGQNKDPEIDRFLKEAPGKWKELTEYSSTLEGFVKTTHIINGIEDSTKERFFKKKNDSAVYHFVNSKFGSGVFGINPRYSFELRKNKNKKDFFLLNHAIGNIPLEYTKESIDGWIIYSNGLLYVNSRTDLNQIINSKTFKLIKVEPIIIDGRKLMEITFENKHPISLNKNEVFNPVQGGKLVLDPENYWCLYELEIRELYSPDYNKNTKRKYNWIKKNIFPVLTKISESSRGESITEKFADSSEWELTCELNSYSNSRDDSEFTLSAFGLPEPMGMPPVPQKRPWLPWTLLGIGVFAVSAGIRYYLRRQKGKPESTKS